MREKEREVWIPFSRGTGSETAINQSAKQHIDPLSGSGHWPEGCKASYALFVNVSTISLVGECVASPHQPV